MKPLGISFEASLISESERLTLAKNCLPAIEHVIKARDHDYDSPYGVVNLPFDQKLVDNVLKLAQTCITYNPSLLIVIGVGGSNLGTKAIAEALLGNYQYNAPMPVYYVDTVDADMVSVMVQHATDLLDCGCTVLVNIVTKSGTTTETIALGTIFIDLIKEYYPETYRNFIIITTDKNSQLETIAQQEKFVILEVPPAVGGRYSVFSAVGLFPLAMMGIDIHALQAGAAEMVTQCTDLTIENNSAAQSAAVIYELYKRGFVIHNFFAFSVDLCSLGLWHRQLMAESLGKEYDLKGQKINTGIRPTVSIGSTDLHSIVELDLGGPLNCLTMFLAIADSRSTIKVTSYKPFEMLVPHIQGKSLTTIMGAIQAGTKVAYKKAQRPYISVTLANKSEQIIGQFMQWKILETIYLGHLLGIDPFIQPQVELYKKETRALLAQHS